MELIDLEKVAELGKALEAVSKSIDLLKSKQVTISFDFYTDWDGHRDIAIPDDYERCINDMSVGNAIEYLEKKGYNITRNKAIMTLAEAVNILEAHNRWRRDNSEEPITKMTNPTELGIAIDTIVEYYKNEKK